MFTRYFRNIIFSSLSLLLSTISLIAVIKINHDLSLKYHALDGKTQLLLGLTQFLGFYFKFYIVIAISLISVGLSIIAFKKGENRKVSRLAIFLGFFLLIVVIFNIGRFMM
jgi:hypothetical protein